MAGVRRICTCSFPTSLPLGQIHSALAYSRDHKAALDADIAQRDEYAERMRQEAGPWRLMAKISPAT